MNKLPKFPKVINVNGGVVIVQNEMELLELNFNLKYGHINEEKTLEVINYINEVFNSGYCREEEKEILAEASSILNTITYILNSDLKYHDRFKYDYLDEE